MKYKAANNWDYFPESECLLFFAQRLDELLFDYSLDTYKAPALTSTFLCHEALNLIQDIETGEIDAANLSHVLEELSWSLTNDMTAKTLLSFDVNKYILSHEDTPISEKLLRLEILFKEINPRRYIERIGLLLIEAIHSNHKKKIDTLARSYISTLINMGVSKTHLYASTQKFFFEGKRISSLDDLVEFFIDLLPVTHTFEVYFLVSNQIEKAKVPLKKFNIDIIDSLPKDLEALALAQNFTRQPSQLLAKVANIHAFDIHSGRQAAERKLERIRDLFSFFSHKSKINWESKTLVQQCCLDAPVVALPPKSAIEKCFDVPPAIAANKLSKLLDNLSLETGGSNEKFDRIIDIHGVCVSNDVPENQLINLWTAIETIIPSNQGKNKVNNVIEKIIPVLMLLYVRRLLDRVTSDLVNWNKKLVHKYYRKIPDAKGEHISVKTLLLIGLESNREILDEIQNELAKFPLLRFRLFQLSDTFSKPENVLSLFENHKKKVAWQIRRIYRTRNLIVHSGRAPTYLNALIENAHDYLDSTISEMIALSCGSLEVSSLNQVFELSNLKYANYLAQINDMEQFTRQTIPHLYYNTQREFG